MCVVWTSSDVGCGIGGGTSSVQSHGLDRPVAMTPSGSGCGDMLNRVIVRGTGGIKILTLLARLTSYSSSRGLRVWEECIG